MRFWPVIRPTSTNWLDLIQKEIRGAPFFWNLLSQRMPAAVRFDSCRRLKVPYPLHTFPKSLSVLCTSSCKLTPASCRRSATPSLTSHGPFGFLSVRSTIESNSGVEPIAVCKIQGSKSGRSITDGFCANDLCVLWSRNFRDFCSVWLSR